MRGVPSPGGRSDAQAHVSYRRRASRLTAAFTGNIGRHRHPERARRWGGTPQARPGKVCARVGSAGCTNWPQHGVARESVAKAV